MTTPESKVDIIDRASALFDTRGWVQGAEVCDTGAVCAIGAVQIAMGADVLQPVDPRWEPYLTAPGQGPKPKQEPDLKFGTDEWAEYYGRFQDWHRVRENWLKESGYLDVEAALDNAAYQIALEEGWAEVDPACLVSVVDFNDSEAGSKELVQRVFARAKENILKENA